MNNLHKRQIYAGLLEIIKDNKYYYNSAIGKEYSKFSEPGKEALIEYMTMMAPYMLQKEKQELEQLAKDMVWNGLTK